MKYVVISIFDAAAGTYSRPEYVPAAPVALRGFREQVNEKGSHLSKHADDYTLYEMGAFDDNSGKQEWHDEPIRLARGKDLLGG